MARFSTLGRAWFGYLAAKAGLSLWESRQEHRERLAHFHGYPWSQVEDVLRMCYDARPDVEAEAKGLSEEARNRFVAGLFTSSPATFRSIFGFDRPPPAR